MQARLKKQLMALGLTGVLAAVSSPVWASAFQLMEQNAAGVGDWHAGGAAEADDASTGFYNPAGLTRIHNQQIVAGGVGIFTNFKYTGSISGPAVTSKSGVAKGGTSNFVPNFHYAKPINDKTVFGFGLTVPFGLSTNYTSDSIVGQYATKTELKTVNLNPNVAYQMNDKLSVGFGLNAQYADVTFNNYFLDAADDTNTGDDWAFGWNVGALYEKNEHTRFGLSYRSQIKHHLTGKGTIHDGATDPTDIWADITLPATTMLSGYHDINQKWSVMGTVSYTQWDVIKALSIHGMPGDITPNPLTNPMNFRNTWNLAAGAHYKLNEKWTLKGGLGFDQTPTNSVDRDVRLPDNNRFIIAAGAKYRVNNQATVSGGWTHLFMRKTGINKRWIILPGSLELNTNGIVRGAADVVGMQLTWDFV